MRELRWDNVRGIYLRLPPEKQQDFTAYLRSLRANEGSSEPPTAEPRKETQTTA